jgi:hypothetical protein
MSGPIGAARLGRGAADSDAASEQGNALSQSQECIAALSVLVS